MNRLWLGATAMVVALIVAGASAQPPHVLLIMVDDLGWMDLHCQGNPRLRTPRVDAFAATGVRFTNAYAASCVCSPSRAALITGLAPARLHITQHGADGPQFWPKDRKVQPPPAEHILPKSRVTLAERLKAIGYATGFFGKWHLSGKESNDPNASSGSAFWPNHHGFDVNVGGCGYGGPPTYFDPYRNPALPNRKPGEYLGDRLADETIAFMRQRHDQPMFICLWTYNVHYPFEAPADLIAHFKGQLGPGLKNEVYGGQIEGMDRTVGRVLDTLDELKIADDTLVIFTSDNGAWDGASDNRPLRAGKGYVYEGGLRIPLIVRWPGVTHADTINDTPVITMDLSATILDAAGVKLAPDDRLDGVSLRPLFKGEALDRETLFFHYPHYAFHKDNRPGAAIREGDYKLVRNFDDDSVELYNLASDLAEEHNLAAQEPDRAAALNDQLTSWLRTVDAQVPTKVAP
ncbi:MAG: sulfatase-like hydrolase/transferase [Phycisphaera sp.]|nr:sulfatase-like hydrolase/transferase [Phycisphaera sp.]